MEKNRLLVNEDDLVEENEVKFYKGEPFNGVACLYYPSGKLEYETTFLNGLEHGHLKRFFENGSLNQHHELVSGVVNGLSSEWFENGHLKSKKLYEHGILLNSKKWTESGELIEDFELSKNSGSYELLQYYRQKTSSHQD